MATAHTNQLLQRWNGRHLGWTPKFAFDLWHFIRFGRVTCEDPWDGKGEAECGHGVQAVQAEVQRT